MLLDKKVKRGDIVMIFMPNIPEAVYSMLACARIGAIHSVVFGGYSAQELANRIKQLNPKVLLSASSGLGSNGQPISYTEKVHQALQLV